MGPRRAASCLPLFINYKRKMKEECGGGGGGGGFRGEGGRGRRGGGWWIIASRVTLRGQARARGVIRATRGPKRQCIGQRRRPDRRGFLDGPQPLDARLGGAERERESEWGGGGSQTTAKRIKGTDYGDRFSFASRPLGRASDRLLTSPQ
jgi:hypothetical protein